MPKKARGFEMAVSGTLLLPWSFSRLKDYERCPLYAWEVHVRKNKGVQSPYAARGEAVHKAVEEFTNALLDKKGKEGRVRAPAVAANYESRLRSAVTAKDARVATELRFGITAKWTPAEFFGKDVWGRGVWDLRILEPELVRVVDHKTGKMYADTHEQLRFYSAAALAYAPGTPKAVAEAWHLDMPEATGRLEFEVTRAGAKLIMRDFEKRVATMAKDTRMEPKANSRCKWCHLNAANGGTCKEGS